jgi:uncharacterized protein with GYD domain
LKTAAHSWSVATYNILADVNEQEFQNPQELVTVWADIRADIERLGGEVRDSYALVGSYDFQVTFEVEDEDAAIQISMAVERHGLDTETMRAMPIDRLGELIDDV